LTHDGGKVTTEDEKKRKCNQISVALSSQDGKSLSGSIFSRGFKCAIRMLLIHFVGIVLKIGTRSSPESWENELLNCKSKWEMLKYIISFMLDA
jgi:hypothetical protein